MRATLEQGLPALGMGLELIEPLEAFSRMLLEKNQVMNLTAITEPRDVAALHLLDSLAGLAGLEAGTVVDVGTGAGFPGVPLAIARPSVRVTLLDSLGKRVDFLRESCRELGLENVECVHGRAEEFALEKGFRDSFDFAAARAVANLRVLCELCLPFVKVGGQFLAMKSVDSGQELENAAHAVKLLGGRTAQVEDYPIPGTEITHRLIVVEKLAPTLKGYPRRWAKIQKEPL